MPAILYTLYDHALCCYIYKIRTSNRVRQAIGKFGLKLFEQNIK